jgi:hypothetical protein
MLDVIKLMTKVVFAPVWLLWKGYVGLWWAFEGMGMSTPSAPVAPRAPERGSAFEVTDSRPRPPALPAPLGLLKGGFIGTALFSALFAVVATAISTEPAWADRALPLWACLTGFTALGSIFAVRRVAFVRAQRKSWQQRVRDAATRGAHKAAATATYVTSNVENVASRAANACHRAVSSRVHASRQPVASNGDTHVPGGKSAAVPHAAHHAEHANQADSAERATTSNRPWFNVASRAGRGAWNAGRRCAVNGAHVCVKAGRAAGVGVKQAMASYREADNRAA